MDMDGIRASVLRFAQTHPVLPQYEDAASVLIVGSVAAGFSDELSDVDLWLPVADDAYARLSADFAAHGLRVGEPPPNQYEIDDIGGEYFAFPISRLRQGLDVWDEGAVSSVQCAIIIQDPNGQVGKLQAECSRVPGEIIEQRVSDEHTWLRIHVHSLAMVLSRFSPLEWVDTVHKIAERALALCCWLHRRVPARDKWLIRRAQATRSGETVVPLVLALLEAITPSIEPHEGWPDASAAPVMKAARQIEETCLEAVRNCGFGHLEVPDLSKPSVAWGKPPRSPRTEGD